MIPTPELQNATQATVQLFAQLDPSGALVTVVVVKQRFQILESGHAVELSNAEVRVIDELWDQDAPETSSIKRPSDLVLRKPATDVLIVGSAKSRGGSLVREIDVSIRVGPVSTALHVVGPRSWYDAVTGVAPTAPRPFIDMPLRWEHAWGGHDASDPDDVLEEARNPVGSGVARDPRTLVGTRAPSIEAPGEPIRSHRSSARPAGVGALGRHWEPRRRFVGTYDEQWQEQRMPLPPLDFDERFNQFAPEPLIAPGYLRGGEPVEILGMREDGALIFSLPRRDYFVTAFASDGPRESRCQLDTVILEPNDRFVELTWRAVVQGHRRGIPGVRVHRKELVR